MTKGYSIFLSALFCAFIGSIFVLSLLLPKKEKSELENRYLAGAPELSVETLTGGQFMEDAEEYVSDHIVGRDLWVALKAWSERLSGKQENNGVYFGKDGALINRVDDPDPDTLDKNMGYLDALVGNVSVPVYFGLIPTAAAVWADKLPQGAPTADELSIIDRLCFSTGANTVDLAGVLSAHRDEAIYYRTDHHWTSLGAYYGYTALMDAMGLEPVPLDGLTPVTVTEDFYGTAFSSSGVRWLPPDSIQTYIPADGVEVTSYFTGQPETGSLYVDSYLEQKDKYSYFLGGNQPLCVIETEFTDAPKVLIVRDSYSDSLAPFLTRNFSEIHLWDCRYNLNSLKDYTAENHIDAVIVLYSFSDFISDQYLFLLGR